MEAYIEIRQPDTVHVIELNITDTVVTPWIVYSVYSSNTHDDHTNLFVPRDSSAEVGATGANI